MAIEYELVDRVAHLRMDDGTANVLNRESCDELRRGLARATDHHAGALVLWGRSGLFSGGIDLGVLRDRDADRRRTTLVHISHTLLALWTAPIPTVGTMAAVAVFANMRKTALVKASASSAPPPRRAATW